MIEHGHLSVKVAVPCAADGTPIPSDGIFHEKAGIIRDRGGYRIAWNGSLNETAAGWRHNWESINVYTSWGTELERVISEEENFARLWAGQSGHVIVLDVPEAARRNLMRFMPGDDLPARLKAQESEPPGHGVGARPAVPSVEVPVSRPAADRRDLVWTFIREAPAQRHGIRVGEATAAVNPWPHQVRAFERLYAQWPPKLLIADEVGLGKTIQAGMLLRQAWLARRARRILILAPKAVLRQWQIELREKFNLNWPIYDGRKLSWYRSRSLGMAHEREVGPRDWHREPIVIASSQLLRRHDRADVLLQEAEPWDLVVLDEAHHARRRAAGSAREGGPNALLRLMQTLKERTSGLVLLTATPMQVHPVEVWDLLSLLGLPPEWTDTAFLRFFRELEQPSPPPESLDRMARLFQATERAYGDAAPEEARRLTGLSRLKTNMVLRALRDQAAIPRRRLETPERRAALEILRAYTPIRHLISRHTRTLLRRYYEAGMLSTPIARRQVDDRFIEMTAAEQQLYAAVETYIAGTWNQAAVAERSAVGFVMTIYRRRLASSFQALRTTLERHLAMIDASDLSRDKGIDEDAPDDETADELLDADEIAERERQALAAEERADIEHLLARIRPLPPDSKCGRLKEALAELHGDGYDQVMVFTQYTDTLDFLRDQLSMGGSGRLMCFSGRGGEIPSADGMWRTVDRDEVKRRFRDREADVLLCTDAAAEGLNFQFCGAVINYDMPWNPMRVEQRIGRIDRVGQTHATIRVVNLHYDGTVETDVYRALRSRIGLFETVVGRLQPILAELPQAITRAVLPAAANQSEGSADVVASIERRASEAQTGVGFDIDAVVSDDLNIPERPRSPVTMADLDRVISDPDLLPQGTETEPLGHREYRLLAPGMSEPARVTTDPAFYEEHPESVELWSPGNPLFKPPEFLPPSGKFPSTQTLKDVLDQQMRQEKV
jgi:ERCC4-related helicase